eukprot:gb/GFBE01029962.1/.p1 GENE.gb/GFBE01029962.1/~~gb/GFBE01029962.1/.p1  ORF type:complete len:131 (+),score=34.54 gb/GFBE01029962.1/:1-393(+)
MAVQRKFIWLDQATFREESTEQVEKRQQLRQRFEEVDDFADLFEANDEDFEGSEQTAADRLRWALQEQALIYAMEDGTIFRQPRVRTGQEQIWTPLRNEKSPEELEREARRASRQGRKRRGKRRFGNLKR